LTVHGCALDPAQVHVQRGERLAELIMQLSRDAGSLLLACLFQVSREFLQLFSQTPQFLPRLDNLELRRLSFADVSCDAVQGDRASIDSDNQLGAHLHGDGDTKPVQHGSFEQHPFPMLSRGKIVLDPFCGNRPDPAELCG